MKSIGKTLQFLGMSILPLSIILELAGSFGTRDMLIALCFGIAAFYLGRVIEGYAGK